MRAAALYDKKGMLMIVEVREKSGRKYVLLLNGEKYCKCYPGDLHALGVAEVSVGYETEVAETVLAEVERTVFLPRAKRRSLMLLGKKEYTGREMKKKLSTDGYSETVVEAVLEWLEELRYVNDTSYAERYAFSLLSRHSEREILQKMQQKGFEKDVIKEALAMAKERYREESVSLKEMDGVGGAEESFSIEQEAIRTFLRKKGYCSENADEEKKKKLTMSLFRKGFSMSDIRAVLGECEDEYGC